MAGITRVAQSVSSKISEVAERARREAERAWTKGSRRERVKAATRTFCLVCAQEVRDIFGRGEMGAAYVLAEILCDLSETDGGVCPNPRLLVILRSC